MYETPESKEILRRLVNKFGAEKVIKKLMSFCGYTRAEAKKKIDESTNKESNNG